LVVTKSPDTTINCFVGRLRAGPVIVPGSVGEAESR
jgi:hypothetical protein